ncbi:hypothetical protein GW17_00038942 [Ensete ventricosum]|nr:hypothetical protein GW17_00038942 [Ensete ventricosum]
MIRAGGASCRNHRPPPPPPFPPSPRPPLPPNPSSLSTLSPLAPPFSLDHVFPSPPSSSHHHPLPPQPFPDADRPSASRLPSRTVASSAAGSIRSQPSTGSVGDPYYSHYYSNSQLLAFDDSFRHSSAYCRDRADPWNRPADEEVGLEMDSDAYKLLKFYVFRSQSCEWLQDKHPEKYEEDMASCYTVCSTPFSAPSALLEEIHGSGTTGSTTGMDLHDTSVPNSTYDRYMAQLDSCSVNPLVFYPAATYSTPSQVYAPSNLRASSNFNSTPSCAMVHHEIPYKINDPVIKPSKLKEPNLDQNLGSKAVCDEKSGQNYNIVKSIVSPVDSGKDFPSSSNTASESPFNPAVLNPGLRLENLVIADASPSMCNSVEPDKSMKNSLEALDQHNLAVDSPCWKGAPAFWQSPFTVEEMLVQKALDQSKNFDDLCQDRKQLFEGVVNSKDSAEQVGSLIFSEMKQSSTSDRPQFSSVISTIHEKPEKSNKKLSDYRKGDNGTRVLIDDAPKEQMNETSEVERRDSEVQDVGAARVVGTEGIEGCVNDSPLKTKGSWSGISSPTLDGEEIGSCHLPREASSTHELNKSEDIESSVMARFKVLKDRIISSNYRSMEEQGTPLNSEDTGTCSDAKENTPGSLDVADSSGTKDRINLADLGFVEGVVQPYDTHEPRPWFPLSETRLDVQPPDATSDGEIRPGLDTSKYENTEVFSSPLNGSLIQSYMTYKQGSCSLTGGHINPSFEWEHVPREESTQ